MRATTLWIVLMFVLALGARQSTAGTVAGVKGQKCYPTDFHNYTSQPCLSVYGDWIENIDRATTAADGVTVTILGKYNGLQNNTGSFAGKGRVDLNIKITNGHSGNKTIKLIDDPFVGFGGNTYEFTITEVDPPTVTSVDVPAPADPFNSITVTLHGTGLQDARDPASGTIVQDNLIPLVTVGGSASVSSVRVLSSSSSSLQAQIFFTALVQDATVELALKSENECVPLGVLPKPTTNFVPFKKRVHVRSANIRNYVTSITFPNGSTIDKNSIGTLQIHLLFPAPGGGRIVHFQGTEFTLASRLPNENSVVSIKFVPANIFQAVPNGTPINATGFTVLTVPQGDNVVPVTFKITDCLGGQPGTTNTVKIQTWMHNTNTTLPPDFVEQTFQVRCTQ